MDGLKRFFVAEIEHSKLNEAPMFTWLEKLGYDDQLNSVRSRCFMLAIHSFRPVSVDGVDAVQTDIDAQTSLLIAEKFE